MFGTVEAMRGSGNSEVAKRFYKPAFTSSSKKERNKNLGPPLTSEDLSTATANRDSSASQEKEGMGFNACVFVSTLLLHSLWSGDCKEGAGMASWLLFPALRVFWAWTQFTIHLVVPQPPHPRTGGAAHPPVTMSIAKSPIVLLQNSLKGP